MNVVAVAYGRFQPLCLTETNLAFWRVFGESYVGDGSLQWKFDCLSVKEHIKGCGRIAFQIHRAFFLENTISHHFKVVFPAIKTDEDN